MALSETERAETPKSPQRMNAQAVLSVFTGAR